MLRNWIGSSRVCHLLVKLILFNVNLASELILMVFNQVRSDQVNVCAVYNGLVSFILVCLAYQPGKIFSMTV